MIFFFISVNYEKCKQVCRPAVLFTIIISAWAALLSFPHSVHVFCIGPREMKFAEICLCHSYIHATGAIKTGGCSLCFIAYKKCKTRMFILPTKYDIVTFYSTITQRLPYCWKKGKCKISNT